MQRDLGQPTKRNCHIRVNVLPHFKAWCVQEAARRGVTQSELMRGYIVAGIETECKTKGTTG